MNYKMKKDGGPKRMKKGGKKKISYLAKKGGAKPDYLDMDGDGNKTESMKSAVASKKKMKLGGTKEMKDLKKSQREARKELRKGQRGARKEQRGQEREERKDNRARKKAVRKIKKAFKGKGMAKRMGDGGMRKRQTGGFLEMPTFDLDRDSI
jgi:hypothetical protein